IHLGGRLRLAERLGLPGRRVVGGLASALLPVPVGRHGPLQTLGALGERQMLRDDLVERCFAHSEPPASDDKSAPCRRRTPTPRCHARRTDPDTGPHSRHVRPERANRPMCCLLLALFAFGPRLVLAFEWIFGHRIQVVFSHWWWPLLGLIF